MLNCINDIVIVLNYFQVELATILYPVFVHMYLQLVYNGHEMEGKGITMF